MLASDVALVHETIDSRIWRAETDRGPREVAWHNVSGWSIKPVEPPGSSGQERMDELGTEMSRRFSERGQEHA